MSGKSEETKRDDSAKIEKNIETNDRGKIQDYVEKLKRGK